MEVAVHPAGGRDVGGGRPAVGVLFQQGAPLQEAVLGQLVEGVPGAAPACGRQQVVDQREGVGGVGAPVSAGAPREPRARLHDLLKTGVHGPEQRSEPLRLGGGELGARPVQPVDPGVQGVAPAADLRDCVTLCVLQGRGDGHAE